MARSGFARDGELKVRVVSYALLRSRGRQGEVHGGFLARDRRMGGAGVTQAVDGCEGRI